jgi:antitoxin ParD1/3/4
MASSVNLGAQLETFITEAVKNGRYGSRSEVLREGVRLVQEREARWARYEADVAAAEPANGALLPEHNGRVWIS